jgi:hypothetical protein
MTNDFVSHANYERPNWCDAGLAEALTAIRRA